MVALSLRGDNGAYCELVIRCKGTVLAVVRKIVPDYHTAEDVAQECFIDAYLHLSDLLERDKVCSWFCGIARRKALHYITRRKHCEDIVEFSDELFCENTSPEDILIKNETSRLVINALDRLSDKIRAVTQLYYFEEKSVSEIADTLNIPNGTVKRRLHDAREKLKGELSYMNENKQALTSDFEKEIMERIIKLQRYYKLRNVPNNGFKEEYSEIEGIIQHLPESQSKYNKLATLYTYYYWYDGNQNETKEKIKSAAIKGNNATALCEILVNDVIVRRDNNFVEQLKYIDDYAVPMIEKMNSPSSIGLLLFWRGYICMKMKNINEARLCFVKACDLIEAMNIYHANSIAAVRAIDYMLNNTDSVHEGFHVMGECITQKSGVLTFNGQPGFSLATVMYEKHKKDAIFYYASRMDDMFYDTSMPVGETRKSADGSSELTLAALGDTVKTAAGTFKDCMHIIYSNPSDYSADIWYAQGVGLVKAVFKSGTMDEEYELAEYTIHGGQGYMPAHIGNRWRYIKPDLPDYLYQCYEREIDWTNGEMINFSVIQLVAMKKDFMEGTELDSDIYIKQCENLCGEWKLDEAINSLKLAVRKNSSQNAVITALSGMEYLKKVKEYQSKSFRFCPSSYNSSVMRLDNGVVRYEECGLYSFGPYRWGSRHEENRIFGVKPFRALHQLFGKIYDEKWVSGYTQECLADNGEVKIKLSVSDGGTVNVKAGSFDNCIKLTVSAQHVNLEGNYYFKDFLYTHCGDKEYWFAPGVGIVKFDFTWGTTLKSSAELVSYSLPAADKEYMPVQIGNRWEYEEVNLASEGYSAKRIMEIACGMDGVFLMTDIQEFVFLGTEEEYEAFKLCTGMK